MLISVAQVLISEREGIFSINCSYRGVNLSLGGQIMWKAFVAASMCRARLEASGLSLDVTADPEQISQSIAESGKTYTTPWLDPKFNDFGDDNFFWLIGRKGGTAKIVGGGRVDVFHGDAASRINRMFNRGYGPGTTRGANPACSQALNGRVAYLGDLHSSSARGLARTTVSDFLGVAHFICASQFHADVVYSFFSRKDARRGSADVNGFTDKIIDPLMWGDVPAELDASGVLAYRPREKNAAYFGEIIRELGHTEAQQHVTRPEDQPSSQGETTAHERVKAA